MRAHEIIRNSFLKLDRSDFHGAKSGKAKHLRRVLRARVHGGKEPVLDKLRRCTVSTIWHNNKHSQKVSPERLLRVPPRKPEAPAGHKTAAVEAFTLNISNHYALETILLPQPRGGSNASCSTVRARQRREEGGGSSPSASSSKLQRESRCRRVCAEHAISHVAPQAVGSGSRSG